MDFLLGVISSIVAGAIIYIFKSQFINITNIFFFRIYPNISGTWKISHDEMMINEKEFLEVSQFGSKVKGICKTYVDDKLISEDIIKGGITPNGLFQFTWESKNAEHHQYGSAMVKVSNYKNQMKGFFITMCCECESNPACAEFDLLRM